MTDMETLEMAIVGYKRKLECERTYAEKITASMRRDLEYCNMFVKEDYNIWSWYDPDMAPEENYRIYQENVRLMKEKEEKE